MSKKLERSDALTIYSDLMEQVRLRLDALRESLLEIQSNPEHPNAWRNVEFCYLQIRMICECVALAVLAAHGGVAEILTSDLRKEWNAGTIFARLKGINADCMPRSAEFTSTETEKHHVVPREENLTVDELTSLYGSCGERLHIGSLKSVTREKQPFYIKEVATVNNRMVKWLESHLIFLPEYNSVLICALRASSSGEVECHFADGVPPAEVGEEPPKLAYLIDHEVWRHGIELAEDIAEPRRK